MWLSNTSTAAMVMPIVDAVLYQLNSATPEERALTNTKPNPAPDTEGMAPFEGQNVTQGVA